LVLIGRGSTSGPQRNGDPINQNNVTCPNPFTPSQYEKIKNFKRKQAGLGGEIYHVLAQMPTPPKDGQLGLPQAKKLECRVQ
jgi:hypothetical protein